MRRYSTPTLTAHMQADLTRYLAVTGRMLLESGAETRQIDQTVTRLGVALGADSVEIALASSSIVITTLYQGNCITTTRRVPHHVINMSVVAELIRICIMSEKGLITIDDFGKRIEAIKPASYSQPLLIFMVALSCASFSLIFGAELVVASVTFIASGVAMALKIFLHKRHFSPMVIVPVVAFIATLIAFSATWLKLGSQPDLAMAASVLLLIPGFPLVNAVSDLVKGYITMGMARWGTATLITISAVMGIVAAVSLTDKLVGG